MKQLIYTLCILSFCLGMNNVIGATEITYVASEAVYVNSGSSGHWLKVRLQGDGTTVNRSAIGTQVRIDLGGGKIVTRQVESGTGEGNQNDMTLHFGLGDRVDPVVVEVFWPDGTTAVHNDIGVDSLVEISY